MSLSLLVTIKCLRNGFMTRIVSFIFRCHTEAQYHIVYTMVTSLYTTTPLQWSSFPTHITSHCPHTGDLLLSLFITAYIVHIFTYVNHIYILYRGNVCIFPPKTFKLLMHTYISFSLGQKKQLSKQD